MKSVTVIVPMFRPGGWDVLLYGLMRQTYVEFDVIVPDERYAKRHRQVIEYARSIFFRHPLYHVPLWRHTGPWNHPATAINTALALATGELIILLVDYAYVPPDWVERHVNAHSVPRLVMGRHRFIPEPALLGGLYVRYPVMTDNHKWEAIHQREANYPAGEISLLKKPFSDPGIMHVQGSTHGPTVPGARDHMAFYAKNDSFPLRKALDVNGFTEEAGSHDFGERMLENGVQGWALPESEAICFDMRQVFPEVSGAHFGETVASKNSFEIYELRRKLWTWRGLALDPEPILRPSKAKPEA